MKMNFSRLALVTTLALFAPLSATQAQIQGDSFGGSFEPEAPPPALVPATPPVPGAVGGGGDFGGSFGDVSTPPAPPAQPPVAAPPPGIIGGGDFDGGSFDDPSPQPQPQPPQPQPPQPPASTGVSVPDQVTQLELQDYGVHAPGALRQGQFHAATPTTIPGAQIVTTKALADAMSTGTRMVLIDVLGGQYSLPGAMMAPALAQGGTFQDRLQQQAAQWLTQVTGGDTSIPIVIYCSDPMCWLSYNAALRTIAAGYGNVYWYRGGLHAWQMAGFSLQPASF